MIDPDNGLDIYDKSWQIYTSAKNLPPHYLGKDSKVTNSLVNEACNILGQVEHSVLFANVTVEEGALVKDSVILSDCVIKKNAKVNRVVMNEGETIEEGVEIGNDDPSSVYLVSDGKVNKE